MLKNVKFLEVYNQLIIFAKTFIVEGIHKQEGNANILYQLNVNKVMKSLLKLTFAFFFFVLLSCGGSETDKPKASKSPTKSAPYEMCVVAEKAWFNSEEGNVLRGVLACDIPGLPQSEQSFKLMNVAPNAFSGVFRSFANIVMVDYGKQYDKPKMSLIRDAYAHPQYVVKITAPSSSELVEFAQKRKDELQDIFVGAELHREHRFLTKQHSGEVNTQAQKQFGVRFFAPTDINSIKEGYNFFWASSVQRDNMLNVCMYSYPFDSIAGGLEVAFSKEWFIFKRNEIMKKNIQGDHDGQYMTTQPIGLVSEVKLIDNHPVNVIRGLWEMENDAMGGPFVSYVRADSAHNRMLVAEGFIFAPEKKKREMMRELEAGLKYIE